MKLWRQKHGESIPPSEKAQLEQVKTRLDKVERRVVMVETQLRVLRRDA